MSLLSNPQLSGRIAVISFIAVDIFAALLGAASTFEWSNVGIPLGIGFGISAFVFVVSGFIRAAHFFVEKFFNRPL